MGRSWSNFFWPHLRYEKDPETLAETRIFFNVTGMAITLYFLVFLVSFLVSNPMLMMISAFVVLMMILSLFVFRHRQKYVLATHLQLLALSIHNIYLMTLTGGVSSAVIISLPIIVSHASLILGGRSGVIWAAFWTVALALIGYAQLSDKIPPTVFSNHYQILFGIFYTIFLLVLVVGRNIIYKKAFTEYKASQLEKRIENSHLLTTISHDLRSPLQIIQSYVQIIADRPETEKANYIRQIQNSLDRMTQLLDRVRDFKSFLGSSDKLELVPIDLLKVLTESIEQTLEQFDGKNIEIRRSGDLLQACVLSEPTVLRNYVLNALLENAFKYSDAGSRLDISISKRLGRVVLAIRDYGIGMPPEILHSAFKFSQNAPRSGLAHEKGLGFGLPVANLCMNLLQIGNEIESWDKTKYPDNHGTLVCLSFKAAP
jgi:signal transduction histidine kinase